MTGTITAAQLRAIAGGTAPFAAKIAESFNPLAAPFGLTTPLRQAHFFAQLAHESAGFKYVREVWGPTAAQKRYEGRKDLGNTQAGDGSRYRGRGPIQITGRDNYRAFTAWIQCRYPEAPDFEAEPEKLEEFPWALMAAFWFWDTRGLNALADADDVVAVTKKINGGTNGLADRKAALKRAKAELGVTTAASPPAPTTPAKPKSDRMSVTAGTWAEKSLARYEVEAIQKRLRDLGYYSVGKVDGIWGPSTSGALIALQTQAGIAPDGHWGPQSKTALDDDANRRRIDPARASTTAADLRAQGSVIAIQGSRVTWSSVWQIVLGAMGIFQYLATNWQGNLDGLPFPASLILGFLPPWVAPVLIILLNVCNALAAQGIVKARVVAERTGLHNGEPDPAPSPPVTVAPDGPRLGGILGTLFGAR
ncbi:peptidoglycan-binding protein [Methylobacterium planeticum]|uniref:Peptidoglycan binding-like domain-containing protein n=1 Tax=Methylobacterium planeticum TaxID=2615211 RepID=A0A6N6MHB4_9HYPH|nr:peptidoglycan-binding protein [Methylobacterium planeticum]KAB1069278.1 hypothetical protein F6X51_25740 [Methylobacterium planeticum]